MNTSYISRLAATFMAMLFLLAAVPNSLPNANARFACDSHRTSSCTHRPDEKDRIFYVTDTILKRKVAVYMTKDNIMMRVGLTPKELALVASLASKQKGCEGCGSALREDKNHPNKTEHVYEKGTIILYNEGCKCTQYYPYEYQDREVCCYYTDRSPSGYAWMGMDNAERYLDKERAEKDAPHCKE